MGAGQSSAGGSDREAHAAEVKTSYYELLGIEKDATEDEIKKAYRRKALELHPDRNHGNEENATKLFAEIQAAHEVLSDPQERAWYDSHESEILRGGDGDTDEHYEGTVRVTSAEEVVAMMRKFNRGIDFSDAPSGFFGFLKETFEQLAREEDVAGRSTGADIPDYPTFGHKDDTYEDVVKRFYSMWNGFSTRKSFAWKDKYRLSEAPDRRYRRLMEKENQKARDEAIKEFNEAVQAFVAFVRKRDPRYTPNTQTDADRQKALYDARAAQAARARAENEAKLKAQGDAIPEWAKHREPDELELEDDEPSEEEEFECVACNKTFKSERQFEAHERSKKHQKAVQSLRRQMQKENKYLNIKDDDFESAGTMTPVEDDDVLEADGADEDLVEAAKQMSLAPEGARKPAEDQDNETEDDGNVETQDEVESPKEQANGKPQHSEVHNNKPNDSNDDDDGTDDEDEDNEYASRDDIESRLSQPPTAATDIPDDTPKLGKAKQKKAKKAARQAAADAEENKHKCATCNTGFPSKTRLHQHITDLRHAALKADVKGKGKRGKR